MNITEKSLKTLEYDKILTKLSEFARTTQSKHLCLRLLPETDFGKIKENLQCTREAKKLIDNLLELPIEHLTDLSEINLKQSYISEKELVSLAKSLRSARYVKNFFKEHSNTESILNNIASDITTNKTLEDEIFDKFDNTDNLKKDASIVLADLYSSLKNAELEIKSKTSELLASSQFTQYLQEPIYTIRDERIVFPILSGVKNKISGIIHDVSATNKTAYIEPIELVSLNNKIRKIYANINKEKINILTDLTRKIKTYYHDLKTNEELLALLDFHYAKARYAIKLNAEEPELTNERIIDLCGIKHPLLISRVPNIVANDFSIGKHYKSVIITGSNTGGKTVTLKTIGLFTLMARAGMFLPCISAKIYPFEKVLADIGDEQDLTQNLSTFSSHMNNIINILEIADKETLVLLDEICAGTDPQEGSALAEVILKDLVNKKAICVTTTHFGELKTLEYSNPNFKNACVEFNKETLQPTYKLTIGVPGASNAIFIAKNLGLDTELIELAKSNLKNQQDSSAIVIEKLQETQQKLSKNLQDTEAIKAITQKIKEDYEIKLADLKRNKRKTIKTIEKRFSDEFDNVRKEIKNILNELKNDTSDKSAQQSYIRLSNIEKDLKNKVHDTMDKQSYDEINWQNVKIGDTVMIKDLNQPVKIITLPDKNDTLTVQMGQINTKINKDRIAKLDSSLTGKPQLKLQPIKNFELKRIDLSNKLDLRGFRTEEALEELEIYLDKASVSNLTPVYIIHGHGTGALKSSLRDYISTSPYVAKFRPGETSEGGDGVTVIDIN